MNIMDIRNLSFTYQGAELKSLHNINLTIRPGEMTLLMGPSGSGKSTLLSMLKPEIRKPGCLVGHISFYGGDLPETTTPETVADIGYLCQDPEAQIVTDKVWRELNYAPERLGLPQEEITSRVAEMSAYFGINHLLRKNTWELSGGQKQILNLAAVMVTNPRVLLLDEPTSRLDPVAATEFIYLLHRLKTEFGTAIVLIEHRIDRVVALTDRLCIMDRGEIIAQGTPNQVLESTATPTDALTTAAHIWRGIGAGGGCPIGTAEAKRYIQTHVDRSEKPLEQHQTIFTAEPVMKANNLWHKYESKGEYVLRGTDLELHPGEIMCIMGANGSGKSTLLKVVSGQLKATSGKFFAKPVAMVPQDVTELFVKDKVKENLIYAALSTMGRVEADEAVAKMSEELDICHLWDRHPLELSGGEQQRVALAQVMLSRPEILLLDEPTKSLDRQGQHRLFNILRRLSSQGVAILAVTHDPELSVIADSCCLLFDGTLSQPVAPVKFLCSNRFFTTETVSICGGWLDGVVTPEEAIELARRNSHDS